jgi:hypothetical protein
VFAHNRRDAIRHFGVAKYLVKLREMHWQARYTPVSELRALFVRRGLDFDSSMAESIAVGVILLVVRLIGVLKTERLAASVTRSARR